MDIETRNKAVRLAKELDELVSVLRNTPRVPFDHGSYIPLVPELRDIVIGAMSSASGFIDIMLREKDAL